MKNQNVRLLRDLINEVVKDFFLERRTKRRRKPGGGLTDMGALRRLNPREYNAKVRTALVGGKGDIESASKDLDISSRTLYQALEDIPVLQKFKDGIDAEQEREEEREVNK